MCCVVNTRCQWPFDAASPLSRERMVRTVSRIGGSSLGAIIADFCNKIGPGRTRTSTMLPPPDFASAVVRGSLFRDCVAFVAHVLLIVALQLVLSLHVAAEFTFVRDSGFGAGFALM